MNLSIWLCPHRYKAQTRKILETIQPSCTTSILIVSNQPSQSSSSTRMSETEAYSAASTDVMSDGADEYLSATKAMEYVQNERPPRQVRTN